MPVDHSVIFLRLLTGTLYLICFVAHMILERVKSGRRPVSRFTQAADLNNEFFQIVKVGANNNLVHTSVIYLPITMDQ